MKTRYLLAGIALAAVAPAIAQQVGQPQERHFTLIITEAEARVIDAALGELPTKNTYALVGKIHQQLSDQMRSFSAADAAAAEKAIRDKVAAEEKAKTAPN